MTPHSSSYQPLQAFARGLVDEVAADPAGLVDIVPVDHVADVIDAALRGRDPVLHAVAADHAVTARQLADLEADSFEREPPRFRPQAAASTALAVYHP